LSAHQAWLVEASDVRATTPSEEDADGDIARPGELWPAGPWGIVDAVGAGASTPVSIDGTRIGMTPVSVAVSPGEHTLRLGDSDARTIQLGAGEHWSLPPTAPAPAPEVSE